jgi:hypothetical protein
MVCSMTAPDVSHKMPTGGSTSGSWRERQVRSGVAPAVQGPTSVTRPGQGRRGSLGVARLGTRRPPAQVVSFGTSTGAEKNTGR